MTECRLLHGGDAHEGHVTCPDRIVCMTDGPLCHESESCKTAIRERVSQLRRDQVTRPVIYIGAGTCGLGAGAAKTLEAAKEYLSDKRIAADIVEVGCIGLCSAEPLLDVQLPGRTRISYHGVTSKKVKPLFDALFAETPPLTARGCWGSFGMRRRRRGRIFLIFPTIRFLLRKSVGCLPIAARSIP